MKQGKSEKVRIIAAFGDITGFTAFHDDITDDEKELDPFLDKFDEIIEDVERYTGYEFNDTGDGYMCTVDLPPGRNCNKAAEVIVAMYLILARVSGLIDRMEHPRPDGFRIGSDIGYVRRKVKKNGRIVLRGKNVNRAHNLLEIARGHGMVCTDNLRQMVTAQQEKKFGITFTEKKISALQRHRLRIKGPVWIVRVVACE